MNIGGYMDIKLERWNVWWLTGKVEPSLAGKDRLREGFFSSL